MKIEIIKPLRLLEVGKQLDIDREYATNLIKKGFAKSLEEVQEVVSAKEVEEKKAIKVKK